MTKTKTKKTEPVTVIRVPMTKAQRKRFEQNLRSEQESRIAGQGETVASWILKQALNALPTLIHVNLVDEPPLLDQEIAASLKRRADREQRWTTLKALMAIKPRVRS